MTVWKDLGSRRGVELSLSQEAYHHMVGVADECLTGA